MATPINYEEPFVYVVQLTVHPPTPFPEYRLNMAWSWFRCPANATILAKLASAAAATSTKAISLSLMDHCQRCTVLHG